MNDGAKTDSSLDILGVKPVGQAIEHASKTTIDGASNFLSRICMPAAEEFGLLLHDKVKRWRASNTAQALLEAERLVNKYRPGEVVAIHPRLLAVTLEGAGWTEDDLMQNMWAGLLATACTADGRDDGNLVFTNILTRLTGAQVRILNLACEGTSKALDARGLLKLERRLYVPLEQLLQATELTDIHRLDIELDSLRELGLIVLGFDAQNPDTNQVDVTATALAINLYVRCQGYVGSAVEYFGVKPDKESPK